MGNRAAIVFEGCKGIHVYLHWNGGPESIGSFLAEMERRGWTREDYAPARFCQIVGEFFSGLGNKEYPDEGLSLGVFPGDDNDAIDPGDNGVYRVSVKNNRFSIVWYGQETQHFTIETLKEILRPEAIPLEKFKDIKDFFLKKEKHMKKYKEEA